VKRHARTRRTRAVEGFDGTEALHEPVEFGVVAVIEPHLEARHRRVGSPPAPAPAPAASVAPSCGRFAGSCGGRRSVSAILWLRETMAAGWMAIRNQGVLESRKKGNGSERRRKR
jgi:hypothetical protein